MVSLQQQWLVRSLVLVQKGIQEVIVTEAEMKMSEEREESRDC